MGWLRSAIPGEADSIRHPVGQGVKGYQLLTSVAGTAVPGRGTMDRLEEVPEQAPVEFGIPMQVW